MMFAMRINGVVLLAAVWLWSCGDGEAVVGPPGELETDTGDEDDTGTGDENTDEDTGSGDEDTDEDTGTGDEDTGSGEVEDDTSTGTEIEGDSETDDTRPDGLLLQICQGLIDADFVGHCGVEPEECAQSGEVGCLQLYGADLVVGPEVGPVTAASEDPPPDIAGLFDLVSFLDESAKDAITDSGVIVIGDPSAEGEVYIEIDQDLGEYSLTDGVIPERIDPEEEPFDDAYYEEIVGPFLEVLGIDLSQVEMEITGVMMSSTEGTWLVERTIFVRRKINGINASGSRLIFSFHPGTGALHEIRGEWPRLDYPGSQFGIIYASIDELVQDLLDEFENVDIRPSDISEVSLSLGYWMEEDPRTLDLGLVITRIPAVYTLDI